MTKQFVVFFSECMLFPGDNELAIKEKRWCKWNLFKLSSKTKYDKHAKGYLYTTTKKTDIRALAVADS